jgi:hypothetical protein
MVPLCIKNNFEFHFIFKLLTRIEKDLVVVESVIRFLVESMNTHDAGQWIFL